ncbi:hypothetical protein HELRODRAFT_110669 [Helobdella robusta]|uniref:Uncharacterized protein n=1 Tax=Helobdella robusta TaxID=6412 RepID=T1EF41_HELRO|nr:hypothetical protein HELRODRAFT_110669 [Helobdella robusta]ESO07174.1 hypothetical protein HELRODRAFT_110669 [Helobdella robusta]
MSESVSGDDTESIEYGQDDDIRSECSSTKDEEDLRRSKLHDLREFKTKTKTKLVSKNVVTEEYSREENRKERFHLLTLDAYSRHKKFINDYILYYGGSMSDFKRDSSKDKTDFDVIKEHHKFLWDEDECETQKSWEKRLAKKYYDKLYKEYCIADLTYYKHNKVIAMRWRTEKEVVAGKGQFECGEKHCDEGDGLKSWEVNFGYVEHGEKKNALVKLRLCPDCSSKLNYHHKRKEIKKKKNRKRKSRDGIDEEDGDDGVTKKSKRYDSDGDDDDDEDGSENNNEKKPKANGKFLHLHLFLFYFLVNFLILFNLV